MVDHVDFETLLSEAFGSGPGDANLDGRFGTDDLVQVFQAAEFEDGVAGNSGWAEGDWNCDGDFGTDDLVAEFITGSFEAPAAVPNVPSVPLISFAAIDTDDDDRDNKSIRLTDKDGERLRPGRFA